MFTKRLLSVVIQMFLVASMLLAQSSSMPVRAQSTDWFMKAADEARFVFDQGYQTYVLLDPSRDLATQLTSALHWTYVCLGALPVKAFPVQTAFGESAICIVFRALMPLFMVPTAAMQFPNVTLHNDVLEWHQMPNGTWVPWTVRN